MLDHPDRPGMTWIGFERATLFSPRVALGSLLVNRKRKLRFQDGAKFLKIENAQAKEIAKAIAKLTRLVGSTSFIARAGG